MTKLTRTAILTQLFGLFSAALLVAQEAPKAPQPKAVLPVAVKDFGSVGKGEKVATDFEIRNEGDAELEIVEVVPACGCTVASFDRRIAPGASGKVHAELDTASFSGPIAKGITVLTNDPQNPRFQLTLQAEVRPHVFAHPGYARFIYVQGLPAGGVTQQVWSTDIEDFKVLGVSSPYPFIVASFREAAEAERRANTPGRQWLVEIKIQPDAPVGALSEPVVVRTNHPKQAELSVPLSGFVRPLMAATPPVVDFGSLAISEQQRVSIALVNFDEKGIEIQKVESTIPGLEASAQVTQAGHRFQIRMLLKPEMAKGAVSGVVKVYTTSDKKPVFEIPVTGTVL